MTQNFFQSRKDALLVLKRLSGLDKDISVTTKLPLSQSFIEKLKAIDLKLNERGNFFAFSMSIPCLDSAKEWEPKVPSPKKRIETPKWAFQAGLKTMLALRPLLPTISDRELEDVVRSTKDFCYGYYSGPLYLKDLNRPQLNMGVLSGLKTEKIQPHWMPEGNVFYKIEREGQMDSLRGILQKYNKPLFEGAADGVKYLKNL